MVMVSLAKDPMSPLVSRPTLRFTLAISAAASGTRPLAIQFARASAAACVTSSSVSVPAVVPVATAPTMPTCWLEVAGSAGAAT